MHDQIEGDAVTTTATDEVFALVCDALAAVLERPTSEFTPDTVLADVGADSLALVEVAEIVEERLGTASGERVRITDEDLNAFRTVGDAVGYLVARLPLASAR
jgi:acyl carrier protein